MPEAETLEPTPLAEAKDFADYKRIRSAPPAVKQEDSPAAGVTPASDPDEGETAPVSEAGKSQEKREKPEPPHQKRIRELNAKLKTAEDGRIRLERELEELRKGPRSPEALRTPETPKAEAKPTAEGEPDFEKLLDAAINDKANTTYEKAQAAALREYHKQIRETERKRAEAERTQSEAKTAHDARLAKTREQHEDFDEVVAAAISQVEGVHNPGIEAAMTTADSAEVVYYFATHLDEFRKIAQMNPQAAYRATVALDLKLSTTPEKESQPAQRRVSRAPAPSGSGIGGSTSHNPKNPAEARDYAEYKRLRTAGGR